MAIPHTSSSFLWRVWMTEFVMVKQEIDSANSAAQSRMGQMGAMMGNLQR